jgi:hypothetical protein
MMPLTCAMCQHSTKHEGKEPNAWFCEKKSWYINNGNIPRPPHWCPLRKENK